MKAVEYVTCAAACFAAAACGGGETPPRAQTQPLDLEPGQMGILAGAQERATDAIDGDDDGEPDVVPQLQARFDSPLDMTLLEDGQLLILDWNGHKIRKLGLEGGVSFVLGTGIEGDACEEGVTDAGCPALKAQVNHPTDVVLDAEGRLVVAAWHNSKIKRLDPDTGRCSDICGTGNRKHEGNGGTCEDDEGTDLVSFDLPSGVVYDAEHNLFISDQANQVIRRLGADGVMKVVAGTCPTAGGFGCREGAGYSGDGGPATLAQLDNNLGQGTDPQGKIEVDPDGNLYIADTANHAIRRVVPGGDGIVGDGDPSEEIITTIAGTGSAGYSGDGGPADEAQLSHPTDVAYAPDGSLYIADRGNNCIRRILPDGTITTAAGQCGKPGIGSDGTRATEGNLRQPYGVEVGPDGRLYIADTLNHCIRHVEPER